MGKGGPTTSTTNTSNVPAYAQPYLTQALSQGQALGQNAYTPYTGSQIAPFADQQMQAFGLSGQLGNATNPIFQSAQGLYGNAAQTGQNVSGYHAGPIGMNFNPGAYGGNYNGTNVNPLNWTSPGVANSFMSPYTNNVMNTTASRMADLDAQQQSQLQGAFASQGAYGGDRMGVAQGVLGGQQAFSNAQTLGQLAQQGYGMGLQAYGQQSQQDLQAQLANLQSQQYGAGLGTQQAQTAGQLDLQAQIAAEQARAQGAGIQLQGGNLGLSAGQGLAGLGGAMQNANLQDIQALMQSGGMQQGLLQSGLNVGYQNFLNQLNWPYQQLGFESSLIHGLPVGTVGSQNVYQNPNLVSQMMGLGLGGIGISQALNTAQNNSGMGVGLP